jgi:hypothetical protein
VGNPTVVTGRMTHSDEPDWRPLLDLVGEEVAGDFMWMFEVELANGTRLQAYKHWHTRRYVHLDPGCQAFVYEPPHRYRRYPVADVLAAVFATLPRLWGVTDEEIAASDAALDRVRLRMTVA